MVSFKYCIINQMHWGNILGVLHILEWGNTIICIAECSTYTQGTKQHIHTQCTETGDYWQCTYIHTVHGDWCWRVQTGSGEWREVMESGDGWWSKDERERDETVGAVWRGWVDWRGGGEWRQLVESGDGWWRMWRRVGTVDREWRWKAWTVDGEWRVVESWESWWRVERSDGEFNQLM